MAQHEDCAIGIHHLSKKVKQKQLLTPFTHELKKGKILALCGGNGAGKSTLIRLIIGQMPPTTGEVSLFGFTKKKQRQSFLQQFGYMPDDFKFQTSITAEETIRFYAKLKGITEDRMLETLEEVGLVEKRKEKVGTFSKGMNQRLLLAQTLLAKPNILILDEPTNGLDPYWIDQFAAMMLKAKQQGQTIVFSTHDLHVAEQIADEVVFLGDGNVLSKGSIEKYSKDGLYHTFEQLYFAPIRKQSRAF